jgi:hypothetical protein
MASQGHGDLDKVLNGGGAVLQWDYPRRRWSGGEGMRWRGKWSPKGAKGASIPSWPSAGRVPSRGGSRDTFFPSSPFSTGGDNENGPTMAVARPWRARSVCVGAVGVLEPSVARQGQWWHARVHEVR